MPPSPHLPLKTSSSTPTIASLTTATASGASSPIYAPSRSSSTKSNYTFTSSTTAATLASRSSSTTSRRSGPRSTSHPGPCALPPQAGRHNSLAELHARQANITGVQQPISPYAEERNPLERMGYAVSGMVRRKSSGMELRAQAADDRRERPPALKKKSSFARLGWAVRGGGDDCGVEGRRGSVPGVDVSRNF
jgi:hypothetical protein